MHPTDPVNRVMTEAVLSVEAGAPAGEVLRLFAAYPIHHLPVVDGGKVVGMLGSTDVLKLDMLLPKGGVPAIEYLDQKMCVRQLVLREAVVVGERQSVEEAATLMAKHGIHALPVVNARHHLVGIVTTTDIMNAALGASAPGRAHRAGSEAAAPPADAEAPRLATAELASAIGAAHRRYTAGDDPEGVAAALLCLHHRVALLEPVAQAARRYLAAGQDEHLHALLLKAVDAVQAAERTDHDSPGAFGLGG